MMSNQTIRKWIRAGRAEIEFQFSWTRRAGIGLTVGGVEGEIFVLSVSLCLFSFWMSVKYWKLSRWLKLPYEPRKTGIEISYYSGEGVWLFAEVWQKENEWRRGDLKLVRNLSEMVLGKPVYKRQVLADHVVSVPMPEKTYAAKVVLCKDTWTQPRKFWRPVLTVYRADVDIPDGIPHPGKGTTSYNCDDGALTGVTYPNVTTVDQAVANVIRDVTWMRENYPL